MLKVGHVVATAGADGLVGFIVIYVDLEGIVPPSGTGPGHEESGVWCVWTVTLQPGHRAGICGQIKVSIRWPSQKDRWSLWWPNLCTWKSTGKQPGSHQKSPWWQRIDTDCQEPGQRCCMSFPESGPWRRSQSFSRSQCNGSSPCTHQDDPTPMWSDSLPLKKDSDCSRWKVLVVREKRGGRWKSKSTI